MRKSDSFRRVRKEGKGKKIMLRKDFSLRKDVSQQDKVYNVDTVCKV